MEYIQTKEDLEILHKVFLLEGEDYENHLSLNKEQFSEALFVVLKRGSRDEYGELFEKIDTAKEGIVDWDKFAGFMLLEFYEKDDRVKLTQVLHWQDIRIIPSPHKDVIQKILFLKNLNKYIVISKEGCVSMWDTRLRLQRTIRIVAESCSAKDLWVTSFIPLHNINKLALTLTSKEIAIYDLSANMEFNCLYKIQGLEHTPLHLDYWSNAENPNEAILLWGDSAGTVSALHFTSANISLFDRPSAPAGEKQDACIAMQLKDITSRKYKNVHLLKTQCHGDWVRQVRFIPSLDCFISCSTTWNNSIVLGWMEKIPKDAARVLLQGHRRPIARRVFRKSVFQVAQGINAFDYHEKLNLIATAGVNNHVCLWNPYVVSKPTGLLRGHMTSVVQVKFIVSRGQLASFSKDKILRIWDVQLQVCIQRLAGMFPKGQEVSFSLFFDECLTRLFLSFNSELTVLEVRREVKDRVVAHYKPIVGVIYNQTYNQVVSAAKDGTLIFWLVDTGQKVKQLFSTHGKTELTCLAQDHAETRLLTGAVDGTVKMWDFNGHCYHTMRCQENGQPADVGQILSLKRTIIAVGWSKNITVFREKNFENYFVEASLWIGAQSHEDDILAVAFSHPNILVTGSYDGAIVVWNNTTEYPVRRFQQRSRKNRQNSRLSASSQEMSLNLEPKKEATGSHLSVSSKISAADSTSDGEIENNAVLSLCFLSVRQTGANLVSCGGNGWVRFWATGESSTDALKGEFVAHPGAGNIIMAVDKVGKWLVTGDQDGLIKVWNIANYCIEDSAELVTTLPVLSCQFQSHYDVIICLRIIERNERTLILSASGDRCIQLSDIEGVTIGCFGQEEHWKIEPVLIEAKKLQKESVTNESLSTFENGSPGRLISVREKTRLDGNWEPDERAVNDPTGFRINSWDKTCLGKEYQELRVQKRERKQPSTIPDLPYLYWERTRKPPAGPHAALEVTELNSLPALEKPDFVYNPHRYFSEQTLLTASVMNDLPPKSMQAVFDERTLFPKYILDYESKMRHVYQKELSTNPQKKTVVLVMKPTTLGSPASTFHARQAIQKNSRGKNNKFSAD